MMRMKETHVDIAIPVYHPDDNFADVIRKLEFQDIRPCRIILIHTVDEGAADLEDLTSEFENVEIHTIKKEDFDHGKTRNKAASYSDAPYLIFMTMDAIPADPHLVSNLLKPMAEKNVAVSYARQLPKEGCAALEKINRSFNYPDSDIKKGKEDLERLGVKTFFCSNACACYNREVFDLLGGFVDETIFNEDMIYASKAVKAGYYIYYTAKACVYHSHNYSLSEQYHRNFDLGVSQAEHPEVFEGISSESEGMKLVRKTILSLAREKKLYLLPGFILFCAARYLGFRKGKRFDKMSRKAVLKMTANPDYFLKKWSMTDPVRN
ncbi:MAG: glycosyltransferase [Lachnospiraceae bacterium]|nr:glycosyltransferase [Lachnospiraceae bacterium]